jgi:hypothetical protein
MKSNPAATGPSVPSGSKPIEEKYATRRGWLRLTPRIVIGASILLAIIAVTVMLSNCGERSSETSGVSSSANVQGTPDGTSANQATAALPASSFEPGNDSRVDVGETPSDSLPPDVAVSVTDTLVAPGTRVEIMAETTIDAGRVLLWDGIHAKQPFVYDVGGKVWKTTYRVPLRPSSERLALSVTAINDKNRWRRVWVFVRVQQESKNPAAAPSTDVSKPAAPDSSGTGF